MSKAKLRTKTGCLTCRGRRVKCGEQRPKCDNCSSGNLSCTWPAAGDLYDHRYRHLRRSRRSNLALQAQGGSSSFSVSEDKQGLHLVKGSHSSPRPIPPTQVPALSTCPYNRPFQSNREYRLFHYFCDTFLSTILLSDAHAGFYDQYRTFLGALSLHVDSVKWAVLACGAVNKFMFTMDEELRTASLKYYSRAVSQVKYDLRQIVSDAAPSDGILTTIMYLYLFSLWGLDTTDDAAKHVEGAVWAVNLRFANSSNAFSMARVADRVLLESVLYQSCLLAIRQPFKSNFKVDRNLIRNAESTLQSLTFTDVSPIANSPVLGLPLQLYQLVLRIAHFASSPSLLNRSAYFHLQKELDSWKHPIIESHDETGAEDFANSQNLYLLVLVLYTTAASILLDLVLAISECGFIHLTDLPNFSPQAKLQTALRVLRHTKLHDKLTACFLGPWALQILGYVADCEQDIALIRTTLQQMEKRMGYGEVTRILECMEPVWSGRVSGNSA